MGGITKGTGSGETLVELAVPQAIFLLTAVNEETRENLGWLEAQLAAHPRKIGLHDFPASSFFEGHYDTGFHTGFLIRSGDIKKLYVEFGRGPVGLFG